MKGRIFSSIRLLAGFLGSAAVLTGCVTGQLNLSDLPEQPIAVQYWSVEDARKRTEIIEEASKRKSPGPTREGVARLEDLGALVGLGDPGTRNSLRRFPGYLGLVDPRTGEVERVEAAPPGSRPLSWSEDGLRLMFVRQDAPGMLQLFEYDRSSREVRRLTTGPRMHPVGAYGPGDRMAYLAVSAKKKNTVLSLEVAGRHGEEPRTLLEGVGTDEVAWSGIGGGTLVYVKYVRRPGKRDPVGYLVAQGTAEGSEARVLGPGKDPAFSPDGEWIVYTGPEGDSSRIRRMRWNGSGRSAVGQKERTESDPSFSPGGQFVVYVGSETGRTDRLFVRRFDGTGDRVLIADGGFAKPVW